MRVGLQATPPARVFGTTLTRPLPPQSPEKVLPTGEVVVSENPPELLLTTGEVRGVAGCQIGSAVR